ncbi:MAG: 6-carboxytetrahydropterin synthase [Candidatus Hydrogenedentes bacterium]|nr:6-carboxytetrahydropterin synthase [Candidatus Hydrogenedentota bacterium]
MKAHLVKIMLVEAAHRNPLGGEKQRRLHGHSYRVELLGGGAPNAVGWVVDFAEMKERFRAIYKQLDHHCLNDIPGLSEDTRVPALTRWIEAQLAPMPAWLHGVRVSIAGDLAFCCERLVANDFEGVPERLKFTFEAAQSLPHLPGEHQCKCTHGHSYRIEAGARDLAGLEGHLRALYDIFDHSFLNEIAGLESAATCERICEWVWQWLEARGVSPTVIIIQETPTARCLYFGEA